MCPQTHYNKSEFSNISLSKSNVSEIIIFFDKLETVIADSLYFNMTAAPLLGLDSRNFENAVYVFP